MTGLARRVSINLIGELTGKLRLTLASIIAVIAKSAVCYSV
jgi:hypothetical protein